MLPQHVRRAAPNGSSVTVGANPTVMSSHVNGTAETAGVTEQQHSVISSNHNTMHYIPQELSITETDCVVSEWSPLSPCTLTCDSTGVGGYQIRSREIKVKNSPGGEKCPALEEKVVGCNKGIPCRETHTDCSARVCGLRCIAFVKLSHRYSMSIPVQLSIAKFPIGLIGPNVMSLADSVFPIGREK